MGGSIILEILPAKTAKGCIKKRHRLIGKAILTRKGTPEGLRIR
jgi:hypothetical protein